MTRPRKNRTPEEQERFEAEQKERYRQRRKDDYHWYKSLGICVKCHKEPAADGHVLCKICNYDKQLYYSCRYYDNPEKFKAKSRAQRQKALDEHRCVACNKPLDDSWKLQRCPECTEKYNRAQRERTRRKNAGKYANIYY